MVFMYDIYLSLIINMLIRLYIIHYIIHLDFAACVFNTVFPVLFPSQLTVVHMILSKVAICWDKSKLQVGGVISP